MTSKRHHFSTCLILYAISFAASLLMLFFYNPATTADSLDVDETYYYTHAMEMVNGEYVINDYRPIGFPLVLAGALFLSHSNILVAKILLSLISSLRAPLLFLLVKRTVGNYKAALLSAFVVIFWPTILYYSSTFYSESISLTVFIAFLYLLPTTGSILRWILAGVALGMLMLIHPMYLFFTPFVFLIIYLENCSFRYVFKSFAILLCATMITIAPWTIAISLKEGRFVLVSVNGADAIGGALNSKLIETGYEVRETPSGRLTIQGPGMWTSEFDYLTLEEKKLPNEERNGLLLHRIIEWIKNHPYDALYLEAAKLANLWGFYPMFWSLKYRIFLGNIPILIVLFMGFTALWKWRTYSRELCRYWLIPVFITMVALITVGSWRYRLPADVALIVLSTLWFYPPVKEQA